MEPRAYHHQILDILRSAGIITGDHYDLVLAERKPDEPVEQALIRLEILSDKLIQQALAKHYKVPFVVLTEERIDKEVLKTIPEEIIRKYMVIPLEVRDDTLSVAMVNPLDIVALENLQIITGHHIKPHITYESMVTAVLNSFYQYDVMGDMVKESFGGVLSSIVGDTIEVDDAAVIKDDAPVVKLVNVILEEGVASHASDIHFECQEKQLFIRYRIDGILHTKGVLPKEIQAAVISRIKIMAQMDISEKRIPQDGQIRMTIKKRDTDFRISTLPSRYGEKTVIRILDKSNFSIGLEHLGLLPDVQTKVETILESKNGIILVSGPTGSGKSTTLYSMVNRLKSTTRNIITLEDPVEFELLSGKNKECGITQVQINPKINMTFTHALRACLRQDPDVIFVGEIRDSETCSISINAALTGHLVLSSIHTNDAISTITRLLDMGIEPYLIASSLMGVLSQRLVRMLCVHCRQQYVPPPVVLKKFSLKDKDIQPVFYRPVGCPQCNNSGYKGRRGVFELFEINEQVRAMILDRAPLSAFREYARTTGMVSMKENGMQTVAAGQTTIAELMRIVPV